MDTYKLPANIRSVYSNLTHRELVYINIRWRLCPYQKIEALLPKEGLIVDVGCGYGLLSNLIALKSPERDVIGIDSSETGILTARNTIRERRNIKFLKQDLTAFDFPSCNAVVMSDVFHHLSACVKEDLIKRIYENLERDGILIIQDVDTTPYWKFCFAYMSDLLQHPGARLFYQSARMVKERLKMSGFNVNIIGAHRGYPVADVIFVCKK